MKKYIYAILIPCLLLELCGCYALRDLSYSFRPLEKDEDLDSHRTISGRFKFILNDGQNIIADENKCELLTKRTFILMGKGTLLNKKTQETETFEGEIEESAIDSVKSLNVDSREFIIFWIKDSKRISFAKEDVLFNPHLNPETSYWLIKESMLPYFQPTQLIDVNDLTAIEVEEINLPVAIPLVILSTALFVGIIILVINLPTGPILPE